MADSQRPFWTSLRGSILISIGALVLLGALMVQEGNQGPKDPADKKNNETDNDSDVAEDSQCTRDLTRIINGMRPGRLGIRTGAADLAVELNRWFAKCGEGIDEKIADDAALQQKLVSGAALETLQDDRYLPEDVEHFRNSMLANLIVDNVCGQQKNDVQRVMALFDFVTRYVVLLDAPREELPRTCYESMIWGEGTAEDRAWVFAEFLRQLQIDSVIITPVKKPDNWLFGVDLAKSGLLMFDMRTGLAIPARDSAADAPFPIKPATLEEVRTDEDLFSQLDTNDSKYPLKKADFEEFKVSVIGTPSMWSERMAGLQFMVEPVEPVALYNGLGENALRPGNGQWTRVLAAGKKSERWTEAQMQIWDYPLQQISKVAQAKDNPESYFNVMTAIFSGPQLIKMEVTSNSERRQPVIDPQTGQPVFAAADHTLHSVRIEQLTGNQGEALRHFGPILTSYRTNPSVYNEEAANFAAMWVGISQFETQRYSAAESTFGRFATTLRQSQSGLVPIPSMQLASFDWKALTHLSVGELPAAIQSLKAAQAMSPTYRNAYLIKRWESINAEAGKKE